MCERFAKSHAFAEVKNLSACSDFEIYDMSAASYANVRAETNHVNDWSAYQCQRPSALSIFQPLF